jgi:hypothetical protein
MMQDEKDRILTLLQGESTWCQHAEARDGRGHPVHYDDPTAGAWDLTGALCVLFSWTRALALFSQLERQLVGHKRVTRHPFGLRNSDPEICSMVAIQEYNDQTDMTFELVRAGLEALAVYLPESRTHGSARSGLERAATRTSEWGAS